jgi:hypothetical protein
MAICSLHFASRETRCEATLGLQQMQFYVAYGSYQKADQQYHLDDRDSRPLWSRCGIAPESNASLASPCGVVVPVAVLSIFFYQLSRRRLGKQASPALSKHRLAAEGLGCKTHFHRFPTDRSQPYSTGPRTKASPDVGLQGPFAAETATLDNRPT